MRKRGEVVVDHAPARAEPDAGGGERVAGVVVCVVEGVGADVAEGAEGRGAFVVG